MNYVITCSVLTRRIPLNTAITRPITRLISRQLVRIRDRQLVERFGFTFEGSFRKRDAAA